MKSTAIEAQFTGSFAPFYLGTDDTGALPAENGAPVTTSIAMSLWRGVDYDADTGARRNVVHGVELRRGQ